MPTAFVTGGSGFIGGALIERLRAEGWDVRALARSQAAEQKVRERGAVPVPGDLENEAMMREGATGAEVAFHAAAKVEDWGDPDEFERLNVRGTANVIAACRAAGVRRLVHVGTEAALMAGDPLVNVDETAPLRPDSPALYSSSKAKAEQLVRAANGDGLETVVIRPRFVWGRGDTTLLPAMVELVRSGRFRWVGGGGNLTATTHVDNTVEGLWLGATKARARERLLRHRRRAGGLPRVRLATARDAGRDAADRLGADPGGADRGRRGRATLAAVAAVRVAAADAVRRLGLLTGVHDRHRPGRARARLPAGDVARAGPGRARELTPRADPLGLRRLLLRAVTQLVGLLLAGLLGGLWRSRPSAERLPCRAPGPPARSRAPSP